MFQKLVLICGSAEYHPSNTRLDLLTRFSCNLVKPDTSRLPYGVMVVVLPSSEKKKVSVPAPTAGTTPNCNTVANRSAAIARNEAERVPPDMMRKGGQETEIAMQKTHVFQTPPKSM